MAVHFGTRVNTTPRHQRPDGERVSPASSTPIAGTPRVAFRYAAKIVCGIQEEPDNLRLARGLYATAINILNPNNKVVKFAKKLSLTYPPEAQEPGAVYNISTDQLKPDEALEVDCEDLKRKLFRNGLPAPYIKGFVVIKSNASLDVTGVYTTRSLDSSCCPQTDDGCCDKKKRIVAPVGTTAANPKGMVATDGRLQ